MIATLSLILNHFIGGLAVVYKDEATSGQVCSQLVQGFHSQMNIVIFRHFTDQFLFFFYRPWMYRMKSHVPPRSCSLPRPSG